MKVLFNQDIPIDRWREFVEKNPFATPFQTPEFFRFYNSVKNLSAIAIAIEDCGKLTALSVVSLQQENGIKGFFSKRAIIYGGPLINEGSVDALSKLLQVIEKKLKTKAIYIEIRNLNNYSEFKPLFDRSGWFYKPYLNFKVPCTDESSIWSNLNRLRKRQIKKAIANGVVISEASNINEVEKLYEILFETYKYKIRKPLFGLSFFLRLYASDFCRVFIVKSDNNIIGGHFCLVDNNVIYDWYGCGLDNSHKDYAPSTMVVYAALQFGAKQNLKYLDFMGAGTPGDAYGVRDFKAQFGGELVEYGRFVMIINPIMYKVGEFGIKLLSKYKK
jgi:serine/alanine adding enzyme